MKTPKAISWLAWLILSSLASAQDLSTPEGLALLSAPVAAEPPAENTLTNGAIAYWRMDSEWPDVLGNYNLIETGSVYTVAGKITNAIHLRNAEANYLYYPDNIAFSALANSITFTAWVNLYQTNASQALWSKDTGATGGGREYLMLWSGTAAWFGFYVSTNGNTLVGAVATNVISSNTWYFVAAQIDTTNKLARLRVGSESYLGSWAETSIAPWGGAGVGTNTTTRFCVGLYGSNLGRGNGMVDELYFVNRLLTDSEITNLWNNGSGKTWPFD